MNTQKVTLNLPSKLLEELRKEADKLGLSMTETIRRGIETELFLNKEEDSGSKIILEKNNHKMVQLVRR